MAVAFMMATDNILHKVSCDLYAEKGLNLKDWLESKQCHILPDLQPMPIFCLTVSRGYRMSSDLV